MSIYPLYKAAIVFYFIFVFFSFGLLSFLFVIHGFIQHKNKNLLYYYILIIIFFLVRIYSLFSFIKFIVKYEIRLFFKVFLLGLILSIINYHFFSLRYTYSFQQCKYNI